MRSFHLCAGTHDGGIQAHLSGTYDAKVPCVDLENQGPGWLKI